MTSTSRRNMNIEAAIYQPNNRISIDRRGSPTRGLVSILRYIYIYIYIYIFIYIYIYMSLSRYIFNYALISFFHRRAVCPVRTTREPGRRPG